VFDVFVDETMEAEVGRAADGIRGRRLPAGQLGSERNLRRRGM
jgi:hypothetical protein